MPLSSKDSTYLLFLWGMLGTLFVLGSPFINIYGFAVFFISIIWSLLRHRIIPLNIPFIVLFGPFVTFKLGGFTLTLADLYLASAFGLIVILNKSSHIKVGSQSLSYLIYPLLLLIIISVGFSYDYSSSLLALIQLSFIYICYLVTLNFINKNQIHLVLKAWLQAVSLASLFALYFFINGQYMIEVFDGMNQTRSLEDASYFWRLTYIYTGFHYLVGISLIAVTFMLFKVDYFYMFIIKFLIFLFLLMISILVNIKTTIFIFFAIGFYYFLRILLKSSLTVLLTTALMLSLIILGVLTTLYFSLGEVQFEFLINRFTSFDSLSARFVIYINVLEFMSNNLQTFLTGIGPGITTRFSDSYILQQIYIGESGYSEGAIDSSYFTFMLEYGLIFILLISYIVVEAVYKLGKLINWQKPSNQMLIQAILIFSILIALTQLVGISKSAWIFPQVLALAHIAIGSKTNKKYQQGNSFEVQK